MDGPWQWEFWLRAKPEAAIVFWWEAGKTHNGPRSLTLKPAVQKQLTVPTACTLSPSGPGTLQLRAPPKARYLQENGSSRRGKAPDQQLLLGKRSMEPLFVFPSAFPYQQETITGDNVLSHCHYLPQN